MRPQTCRPAGGRASERSAGRERSFLGCDGFASSLGLHLACDGVTRGAQPASSTSGPWRLRAKQPPARGSRGVPRCQQEGGAAGLGPLPWPLRPPPGRSRSLTSRPAKPACITKMLNVMVRSQPVSIARAWSARAASAADMRASARPRQRRRLRAARAAPPLCERGEGAVCLGRRVDGRAAPRLSQSARFPAVAPSRPPGRTPCPRRLRGSAARATQGFSCSVVDRRHCLLPARARARAPGPHSPAPGAAIRAGSPPALPLPPRRSNGPFLSRSRSRPA